MRVNRFVFLNLPILSLGDHLSVTTSLQSPLPAGYVTQPVDCWSPPLGLAFYSSVECGKYLFFDPSFLFVLHSDHMRPSKTGVEAHCR